MAQSNVDLHTPENRQRLAKMVLCLFDHWELDFKDQAALLGLSGKNRDTLYRYRNGYPLADRQDLLGRAGHLLCIHKSLRQVFPPNADLAHRWITQPNRRFDSATPLDIMKKGYEGIMAVRRYLDYEREL